MSVITVKDLPTSSELDHHEMALIKGAGAPWIFGAFRSYQGESAGASPTVNNYYQIDNSIHADSMINQYQTVEINNTGNNSNINAVLVSSLIA